MFRDFETINKSLNGSDPLYIFPSNLKKIQEIRQQEIIQHIHNIDTFFLKNNLRLDDCILFKGFYNDMNISQENKIIRGITGQSYSLQNYDTFSLNKNNETEPILKTYSSFTFNPKVALNFTYQNNGHILILRVKKEHNVPGIFLTNALFSKTPNLNMFNQIINDESEVFIARNLKIKILQTKEVKIVNDTFYLKNLKRIYKQNHPNEKNNYNKIYPKYRKKKILFAETMPYIAPEPFTPYLNHSDYFCMRTRYDNE